MNGLICAKNITKSPKDINIVPYVYLDFRLSSLFSIFDYEKNAKYINFLLSKIFLILYRVDTS